MSGLDSNIWYLSGSHSFNEEWTGSLAFPGTWKLIRSDDPQGEATTSSLPIDYNASFTGTEPRVDVNEKLSWVRFQLPNDHRDRGIGTYYFTSQFVSGVELPNGTYVTRYKFMYNEELTTTFNLAAYLAIAGAIDSNGTGVAATNYFQIRMMGRNDGTFFNDSFAYESIQADSVSLSNPKMEPFQSRGQLYEYVAFVKDGRKMHGFLGGGGGQWMHVKTHLFSSSLPVLDRFLVGMACSGSSAWTPSSPVFGFDFFRFIPTGSSGEYFLP